MVCRACGRLIANENANFCEYCGTATDMSREGNMDYGSSAGGPAGNTPFHQTSGRVDYGAGADGSGYRRDSQFGGEAASGYPAGEPGLAGILNGTAGLAEAEPSMSFLHWMVILLLPMVPMIGTLAYFVLLLVWAFGHTASKTRKNWARATLIVTALSFFMAAYMLQALLGSGGMAELMDSIMGNL